jgi:hypothetical protein
MTITECVISIPAETMTTDPLVIALAGDPVVLAYWAYPTQPRTDIPINMQSLFIGASFRYPPFSFQRGLFSRRPWSAPF